ncbi:hypothetical protein GH714_010603 [Hevea brasiliensis]|uniref:Uncharacterized protein n=1 Tax=Hevea brasiliensis TaxID=3981 RepID=A0A6A6NGF8_HEVBR|nr:hypothetical protein GH714_010603 [Hevea brasiliensis]
MEVEENLERDLHALRRLYGLLQTTGEVTLMIIASTQSHSMQPKEDLTNFQRSISPNIVTASTTARKLEEQSLAENSPYPSSTQAVSEQSGLGISSRKRQNREKVCRVCQRTNLKRKNSTNTCIDEHGVIGQAIELSQQLLEQKDKGLRPETGHSQNVKYILPLERVMPLSNTAASQDNESKRYQYVHGLRIPLSEDGPQSQIVKMRKKLSRQIIQDNPLHDSMTHVKEGIGNLVKSGPSMQPMLEGSTAHSSNKNLAQLLMKPTLLDYESPPLQSGDRQMNGKREITKRPCVGLQKQKTFPHEQESDQSAMSSSTPSCSWTSPPETETGTISSNKSRRLKNVPLESSIEESNSSSYESSASYKDVDVGPPQRAGPCKMNRSNSGKAIGRLRRLFFLASATDLLVHARPVYLLSSWFLFLEEGECGGVASLWAAQVGPGVYPLAAAMLHPSAT